MRTAPWTCASIANPASLRAPLRSLGLSWYRTGPRRPFIGFEYACTGAIKPCWSGLSRTYLLKSVSRVQFSPSAHTCRDFFLGWKNWFKRKARERELARFDENRRAVGMLNPMGDKNLKARTGGEKGRHLWPRVVQKIPEGKTSYELSWKLNVIYLFFLFFNV